jgi:hypothetical protein
MGLQLSERETLYQRKQMYENMKIHGIKAQIDSIKDTYNDTYDFYNDIIHEETSFDDKIDTWLTYEEVPTIKTLRSLGWYIETEEFPVIAYIPVLYVKRDGSLATFSPAVDDKVTLIANPIDPNPSERKFLIKDFRGHGFPNIIYYTVKLVPFRVDES